MPSIDCFAGKASVTLVVHRPLRKSRRVQIGYLLSCVCDACRDNHYRPFDMDGTYIEHENDVSSFPDAAIEALIEAASYRADHRGRWVKIRRETQAR